MTREARGGNTLEAGLEALWRGERSWRTLPLAAIAAPASVAYGIAIRGRNFLYDRRLLPVHRAGVPVVSVGNLTAGGTGKTPVSAWLAETLRSRGFAPAVLLRGYGRDEILLHRRWNPEVPVIVGADRVASAREARRGSRDLLILDDGYQHRRLYRDFDLLLLSPGHRLPARLLPRGPFREPMGSVRRADRILVVAKGEGEMAAARSLAELVARLPEAPPVQLFPLLPGPWIDLEGRIAPTPGGHPVVVTSIGQPEGFLRLVEERTGGVAAHLRYRDHHAFREADALRMRRTTTAEAGGAGWIATTEKDAVKLAPFADRLPEVRVLPLRPSPGADLTQALLDSIRAVAGVGAS